MSDLSDFQRLVHDPLVAQYRALRRTEQGLKIERDALKSLALDMGEALLWTDNSLSHVLAGDRLHVQTFIGNYCVSTVDLCVEHHGGMWFETYIFPSDGKKITGWLEVWGQRYATRPEAEDGHIRVCDDLAAGRLETWDGEKLDPALARLDSGAAEGDA